MQFNLDTFLTLITALAGIGMPWLIKFVAKSDKTWLNLVIAWGSSIVLGLVTSLLGGHFTNDISLNVLVAIGAAEASFKLYWQNKILKDEVKATNS